MKVKQFHNANHFTIEYIDEEATKTTYFQSYNTVVAKIVQVNSCCPVLYVGDAWKYSRTTLKYFYLFISEYLHINLTTTNKKQEFQKILDKGLYEKGIVYVPIVKDSMEK